MSHGKFLFCFGAIVALFAGLSMSSMVQQDVTFDEPSFYSYGYQMLREHSGYRKENFHNSKMPVNALQALPQFLCERLNFSPMFRVGGKDIPYDIYRWWLSRLVTIGFGVLLLVVVGKWAHDLYGPKGALLSLWLASFCPTILAHSRYITTDVPTAAMMTLAMYGFWCFCRKPSGKTFAASALALGFAQCTKFTAGLLIPLYGLSGLYGMVANAKAAGERLGCWLRKNALRLVGIAAGFGVITLLIINTCFLWEFPMKTFKDYGMATEVTKNLPEAVKNIPIPTAYGYFQGLLMTMWSEKHLDSNPGRPYLMGEAQYRRWWQYYPIALFLKTPLALWFLLLMAMWRRRFTGGEVAFVALPALALFAYFTFFQKLQLGVRFLLPVLPFVYIFAGRLANSQFEPLPKIQRAAVVLLCAWFAGSSLSYYPHYLSYFNESISARVNAYKYLADSNLDWGQNVSAMKRYMLEHEGEKITFMPRQPVTGRVIVSANHLVGMYDPEQYRWLREKYQPVDHIAYSWLIFDIPDAGESSPPAQK